jgi:valyl-tRNA synthetase
MSEIPKAYNPSVVEDKWYSYWEKTRVFHSEVDKNKKPYTIVIPPPNITGSLTMGHILNNTLQDILIRLKRMQGYNACWVPGIDHASIATETKVAAMLREKGIQKHSISREEFLKYCWEWKEKFGGIIFQQLKKLGVSCDWDRLRFTMDEEYHNLVIKTFVQLFKEGNIYKGKRLVNWCPASKSAISDEEVIYKTVNGKIWYLKYPVKDSKDFITVATTRPETMLGDTAVAVNPHDERYKHLVGKMLILPIVNKEIPVIEDYHVEKEFGTGAVKVTPAHDFNDYEIGKRHNLPVINIFNEDATTNENVPPDLQNLDRYEARKRVVEKFEKLGLIQKIEDYQNNVSYSERGGVPIEPYLSEQWFMKMDELAKPALEVVELEKIKFYPGHWKKTYEHWMTGIKDWCISRQLWWGHRIPVWYNKTSNEIYCDVKPPKNTEDWRQDEDVLDTWASSWLWAHGVFKTDEDVKYYYPTDTLITAPDIIFFWVARMIIAGMHFLKDIPFKHVYYTSVIRDLLGRKMSKSLGNSPDPLDVISKYGADALRFTVIYLAPLGQDVLFSEDKCDIGRNFANKIWNAGRFLLMNAENIPINKKLMNKHIDFVDKWIDSRFNKTVAELNQAMDKFEINNTTKIIYTFVWNDFCDWYIESSKSKFYADNEEIKSAALTRALSLFENLLKIVHPFMPFITEELWHLIEARKDGESISTSAYPMADETKINTSAEKEMEFLQDLINAIRNIRGEMNIPPSKSLKIFLKTDKLSNDTLEYIKKLARAEEVVRNSGIAKQPKSVSAVVRNCEVYIPLEGLIDLEVEKSRLQKEIQRTEGSLIAVTKKLSNENFLKNANPDVVENEKKKKNDWQEKIKKLKEILENLN